MTGAELRTSRKALGLSQGQLAKRLGVSANTVARWERGELTIGRPEMIRMSLTQISQEVSKMTKPQTFYLAVGDVRGSCGHQHRTPQAAEQCRKRDQAACKRQGGGCYSDRDLAYCDAQGYYHTLIVADYTADGEPVAWEDGDGTAHA